MTKGESLKAAREAVYYALRESGYSITKSDTRKAVYRDKRRQPWSPKGNTIVINHEMGIIGFVGYGELDEDFLESASENVSKLLKKYGYTGYFEQYNDAITFLVREKI